VLVLEVECWQLVQQLVKQLADQQQAAGPDDTSKVGTELGWQVWVLVTVGG
jgi:hypothetical protein